MCNPLTSVSCIAQIAASSLPIPGQIPGLGDTIAGAAGHAAGAAAGAAATGAANAAVGGLAGAIQDALGTVARDTVAWWVSLPSPDLTNDPVPQTLQTWLLPFTAAVAVIGILTAAGRMILTRKPTPLADVGSGLLTLAVVVAVGTVLPTLLLKAGDAYSNYVLNASTGQQFGARYAELLSFGGATGPGAAGILIVLGILGLVAGAMQAILLIFRQGAVIILAATLPLAAAGMMTTLTRPWLKKVTGWLLALIFYKPAAATVYATGFLMIGKGGVQEVFVGFAILFLSLVTLPALMRFFTWTTGAIETSSGGGGLLGAVIGGAAAVGSMRAYGAMSAGDQARLIGSGGPGGGPGGAAPGGPGGGPAGGSGGAPGNGSGGAPPGGSGNGSGGPGANPAAGSGAAASAGPGTGRSAPGAGTPAGPAGASTSAGSAAAASAPASGAAATGAATGAAGAAAGPVGLVLVGAQAAQGAASTLADGAAPPGNS